MIKPLIEQLTYMQDFAKYDSAGIQAIVASMVEEQVYTLKDSRDQKEYKITKYKDGNVWTEEDFKGENFECTPEDSDVEKNFTLPAPTTDMENPPAIYKSESGNYYYNFAAVTATREGELPSSAQTMLHSIAPKGWKLPDYDNDWTNLFLAYGNKNNDKLNLKRNGLAYGTTFDPNFESSGFYASSQTLGLTKNQYKAAKVYANDDLGLRTLNGVRSAVSVRFMLRTGGVI